MSRRSVGLSLLNAAGALVIVGALYDLLVPSVPPNHIAYIGAADGRLDPRYATLDLAMLRSIGGCLLAIGVTTLVLTNGPVRRGEMWARVTVAVLVGVSEGNNAYRMFPFDSPWYGPLGFAVLAVAGAVLAGPPGYGAPATGRTVDAEPVLGSGSQEKKSPRPPLLLTFNKSMVRQGGTILVALCFGDHAGVSARRTIGGCTQHVFGLTRPRPRKVGRLDPGLRLPGRSRC